MNHQDQNETYRNAFATKHMSTQGTTAASDKSVSNVQQIILQQNDH